MPASLETPLKLSWKVGPSKGSEFANLTLAWSKYIPVQPTPKQLAFLLVPTTEALYGGAAGPGKSVALLMAALQYADVPGYAALILRRTYTDLSLPGALMDKAGEWLRPTDAHWQSDSKTWRFPGGGSLTFGFLESPQDKYRYQSSEIQFCALDELTQFPESDYRYMFSRLRRLKTSNIPIRMRAASNPGNIGHDWVKQRFLVEANDDRVFLRATLDDNPHLDRETYIKSLENLDPITREQLLRGDWSARQAGNKFKREWFQIVDAAPVCPRIRYWDMAGTEPKKGSDPDWTVGALLGRTKEGIIYICDIKRMRGSPGSVEALVRQTAELDGKSVPIVIEQEPGSSGVKVIDDYVRRVLFGWSVRGDHPTGSKEVRANPLSSQAEAGNVKLVRGPWINAFLDELELFPMGTHDDQADAVAGALGQIANSADLRIWL